MDAHRASIRNMKATEALNEGFARLEAKVDELSELVKTLATRLDDVSAKLAAKPSRPEGK